MQPGETSTDTTLAASASAALPTASGEQTGWTLLRDVGWLSRVGNAGSGAGTTTASPGKADDRNTAAIGEFAMTAVLGATPVRTAIDRCTEYLREPQPNQTLAVRVLGALAGLTAMEGRFDEARAHLAQARAVLEQLGLRVRATALSYLAGLIDLLAEQPDKAEEQLRRGCEDCKRMGERYVLGNLLALLAQATYDQGRYVEAVQLAEEAEEAGSIDDLVGKVTARGARAKALARLGCADLAEPLSRGAVDAVRQTGLLNVHADALRDLAEVLEIAGKPDEALRAADDALGLYQRKGNTVSAQRTRTVLERLRHPA
jgi:tetratricopeptide (TPR) repeat protein